MCTPPIESHYECLLSAGRWHAPIVSIIRTVTRSMRIKLVLVQSVLERKCDNTRLRSLYSLLLFVIFFHYFLFQIKLYQTIILRNRRTKFNQNFQEQADGDWSLNRSIRHPSTISTLPFVPDLGNFVPNVKKYDRSRKTIWSGYGGIISFFSQRSSSRTAHAGHRRSS